MIWELCATNPTTINRRTRASKIYRHTVVAKNIACRRESNREYIPQLDLALDLAEAYPIVITRKDILLEALSYCLKTCILHFKTGKDFKMTYDNHWLSLLPELTKNVRTVSIGLLRVDRASNSMERLAHEYVPFSGLLPGLRHYFPNLQRLYLYLDDRSMGQGSTIKSSIVKFQSAWPMLRTVEMILLVLEAQQELREYFGSIDQFAYVGNGLSRCKLRRAERNLKKLRILNRDVASHLENSETVKEIESYDEDYDFRPG